MSDPVKIRKSEIEKYVIEWNSHRNYQYLALKVVRVFNRKGGITREKYKNMIATPGIDITLPPALQKKQLRLSKATWMQIHKAMMAAFNDMPKKKVEF